MPLAKPAGRPAPVDLSKASWDEIRRVTDKFVHGWIRAILTAFDNTRASTSIRSLIALLEGRETIESVVNDIDWINIEGPLADSTAMTFPVLMRDALEDTAQVAVQAMVRNPAIRIVGAFDVMNPRVSDWIRAHSAERVTAISEESREAIRALVLRGYEEGIPPAALGRMIRSSIGLTARQAQAVANLRARMVADGKNATQVDKVVEKYAAKLLRRRAELIARTETIAAESAGQLELWRQQVEAGNIDPRAMKEWVVTPDDRLCVICEDLDGQKVPLDGAFSGGVLGPPAHPACRCTYRLAFPAALRLVA